MSMTPSGAPAASVMSPLTDSTTQEDGSISLRWAWGGHAADGMVFGPMPALNWSIAFTFDMAQTYGLQSLQVASYDPTTAQVSFTSIPVKKMDAEYGGGVIASKGCTDYCQMYDNCDECQKDSRCQFAPLNGGCVSALTSISNYDCPAPPVPAQRVDAEGGSTVTLKIRRPERMYLQCPCKFHYYIVVYDPDMNEITYSPYEPVREDHRFTYATIPGLQHRTQYQFWIWTCSQDECGTTALKSEFFTTD